MKNEKSQNDVKQMPDFDSDIWNAAGNYIYDTKTNNDQAWNRFKDNVQPNKRPFSVFRSQYLRVAASITLIGIITATAWYFAAVKTNKNIELIVTKTAVGELKKITLPDGSLVQLNSGSTMTVSEDFGQKNREVKLVGQAFFDVKRNEKLPFHIVGPKVEVSVLGTAFDVCSYNGEEATVQVSRGKVKVNSSGAEKILTKGMAVKTENGALLEKQGGEFIWTDGELVFSKASLTEIADAVFHRSGKRLLFEEKEATRTFTGSFDDNTTPEKIAETLSLALSAKIKIKPQ
jgi:ferric-dicitrate binding protein FerR (iron transport regulator)